MLKTQNTETPPAERPGSSTSEFKLTLLGVIAGLVLIAFGEIRNKDNLTDAGVWTVLGSLGTYTAARSFLKGKTVSG